jgi:hypothetical protein
MHLLSEGATCAFGLLLMGHTQFSWSCLPQVTLPSALIEGSNAQGSSRGVYQLRTCIDAGVMSCTAAPRQAGLK